MNKAVFLDRDGTINVEKNYLYKIEDFEFLPGAVEGLRMLEEQGYLLIIITNQSGIARGYYAEKDFVILNDWMKEELRKQGVDITAVYYCPHLPDAKVKKYRKNCECRKPKLGMFKQAVKDYNIDLNMSYAIGDKMRDCSICKETNCRGFLIGNSENDNIITNVIERKYKNISYSKSLLDAANEICGVTHEEN